MEFANVDLRRFYAQAAMLEPTEGELAHVIAGVKTRRAHALPVRMTRRRRGVAALAFGLIVAALASTASSMSVNYSAVTPALTGMLNPGDCKVIGGPKADPAANGLALNFMFHQALQFNPSLPNGTTATAEGFALMKGSTMNVAAATIVDAVISGTQQRGLADENGKTNRLDVGYVAFPKQTLERVGNGLWRVQAVPTGGNCDWLHL